MTIYFGYPKKCPAELMYFNFRPLEVVSRYREPQPQMVENYVHCTCLIRAGKKK